MPLNSEIRDEQKICEILDLAIGRIASDCNITLSEATNAIFVAAGRTMTLPAVSDGVRVIHATRRGGVPVIG